MDDGQIILAGGALLTAGLVASLLAVRVRVPSLVLFLGVGMIIGVALDRLRRLRAGAQRGHRRARADPVRGRAELGLPARSGPCCRAALSLAILGTLVTAVLAGLAAAFLFDLSTLEGLLLGAILSATDGAAIFALLRGSTLSGGWRAPSRASPA